MSFNFGSLWRNAVEIRRVSEKNAYSNRCLTLWCCQASHTVSCISYTYRNFDAIVHADLVLLGRMARNSWYDEVHDDMCRTSVFAERHQALEAVVYNQLSAAIYTLPTGTTPNLTIQIAASKRLDPILHRWRIEMTFVHTLYSQPFADRKVGYWT